MIKMFSVLMLGFFLTNLAVAGDMFTCVDTQGKTTFSDRPCTKHAEVVKETPRTPSKTSNKEQQKASSGYGTFIDRARKVKVEKP